MLLADTLSRAVPDRLRRRLPSPQHSGYFPALDGYRAVAVIAIVIFNVASAGFSNAGTDPAARLLNGLGAFGNTVVTPPHLWCSHSPEPNASRVASTKISTGPSVVER